MGASHACPVAPQAEQSIALGPKGESPVHRNPDGMPNLIARFDPSIGTLLDNYRSTVKKHGTRNLFGSRTRNADGSRGDYVWRTYNAVDAEVQKAASALAAHGIGKGDRVGIYSINREEWVVTEYACYHRNAVVVSIYDTLGEDVCTYMVGHAEMKLVVCSADKLANVFKAAAAYSGLTTVVSMDPITAEIRSKAPSSVKLLSYDEFLAKGAEAGSVAPDAPHPDDLSTIMYTSGTTGDPKGVMLTHANLIATIAGGLRVLRLTPNDVHFSYLPLAHIFERIVQVGVIAEGASIAFYQGSILKVLDDLQAVHPTVFAGVPRVYNRFMDRVFARMAAEGGLKAKLFQASYEKKLRCMAEGRVMGGLHAKVLAKVKAALLGPRVRLLITGSAPLSVTTTNFLRAVFDCQFAEGYGLTETAAAVTLSLPTDATPRQVGPPLICSELKLVDVPEMDYLTSTYPQRGEVWVRGPNVFKGYYKNEQATKEVLTDDGWFATGDVGQWNPRTGTLSIIDRKKNIFKLSQGEYIAVEKVEMAYVASKYVMQIWVYGDSLQTFLVAVVVPDPEYLATVEKAEKLTAGSLISAPDLKNRIMADMAACAKAGGLRGFELVKDILIEPTPFSVENDLLTPTFKARRPQLIKKYRAAIDEMYARLSTAASTTS